MAANNPVAVSDEFSAVPTYSSHLHPGEEHLGGDPSPLYTRPLPSVVFKTTISGITLTLQHQGEEDATQPTFVQQSSISGEVSQDLYKADSLAEISVKLEGRMYAENADTSYRKVKMVDDTHFIWKRSESSSPCPPGIPFSFAFPTTFTDEGSMHPVPPSYIFNVPKVSGTKGQTDYTLVVTITKKGLIKQSKSIRVPIIYAPRSRPKEPLPSLPLQVPDKVDYQWKYLSSKVRTTSNISPVICTLILPASRVFGVEDTIPFFLQLDGPPTALRSLLPSGDDLAQTSSPAISSGGTKGKIPIKPRVVVSVSRRYYVTVLDDTAKRDRVLGYGVFEPLPPSATNPETFSWAGTIKLDERVSVGGFEAGPLKVQDFVVINLNPSDPKSVVMPHETRHGIRLVTDSYVDSGQKRRGYEELHAPQTKRGFGTLASEFITSTSWGALG